MTSFCIEGMWAIVYSVSGVSLLCTLLPLVIDIRSDVWCKLYPYKEKCLWIWLRWVLKQVKWVTQWIKVCIREQHVESNEMDEALINLWVNMEDKEWKLTQWTLKMFISREGHSFVIMFQWLPCIWLASTSHLGRPPFKTNGTSH